MLGKQVGGNGCCTPIVHQAIPTIVTSSPVVDGQQMTALVLAPIDVPFFGGTTEIGHLIDFDTGRPPIDLVIALQRLVI